MTPEELGSPTLDLLKTETVNSQWQTKEELLDELLDSREGTVIIFSYVPNGEHTGSYGQKQFWLKTVGHKTKAMTVGKVPCRER